MINIKTSNEDTTCKYTIHHLSEPIKEENQPSGWGHYILQLI